MTFGDCFVLALLVCAVFFAVRYLYRSRKRGACCGCSSCRGCTGADSCNAEK